ncbi:MAG TPA: SAM-dependent chlorinase/fluorinase [Candidatus Limnocylindria bacterium]|nr:SAM-dependent chlorinase/fluorinase [Candidatus Limnocylindria bacterium]
MSAPVRPTITFLTDFGLDGAAAVCRGVMLSICPDAIVIDITHSIRKYAVHDAAWILRAALPFMPPGVHVAVVDPGVGTTRRGLAIQAERGDVLIGPDNGLLPAAAEALGGVRAARALENPAWFLPEVSATFHGRDVFAPVAAHLAAGHATFDELGPVIPAHELVRLTDPEPQVEPGALRTEVTYVDSFGNIRIAGGAADLSRALGALADGAPLEVSFEAVNGHPPAVEATRWNATFGGVSAGASLLYTDSSGGLALADNQGSAATRLGVSPGRALRITRRGAGA